MSGPSRPGVRPDARPGVQPGVRRWPLHPQPGAVEALSSWLGRLARLYGLSVTDLLTHNLGLVDVTVPAELDYDPPAETLAALAERTGVELVRLRAMTLAGQVPWLLDALHTRLGDAQEQFDTYVRANSVLLAPGEAGVHQVGHLKVKPWRGVWLSGPLLRRTCPVCAADPNQGRAWVWRLPLVIGCGEHGCRLENTSDVETSFALGEHPRPAPVEEPVATLDRYTYQALTTGQAVLPGRTVHVAVWFRLLRSLLDEVSLALSTLSTHGRTTLERIWQATGRPEHGGLTVWRPYEHLDWDLQQAMLHAAATALHLAADGQITARGRLGSALQPPIHQHVYDGDRPDPVATAWQEAMAELAVVMTQARTDPDTARQLLGLLTLGCRTLAAFEEQRAFLFGAGIPTAFLPSARELGRADLA